MRQKLYLFIAAFLLFSFITNAQSIAGKEAKPFFGQTGIKKKISELKTIKTLDQKGLSERNVRPLKSYFKKAYKLRPARDGYVLGGPRPERDEEERDIKGLRPSSANAGNNSTQKVWSNFLATDFYENEIGWPPDPNGAVGSSQVIIATNNDIKVFNKIAVTDAPLVTPKGYSRDMAPSTLFLTLDNFFSPVLPKNTFTSDPHIRYDRLSKRWVVVAIAVGFDEKGNLEGNNQILLAISDGDRVTDSSSFIYYSFNSSLFPYDKKAPYTPFFDYPTLGVDKNSIVIGGNQFGYDSLTNVGYVIDKNKLIHGDLVVYPFELGVANFINGEVSGIYTPQGVYNDDPESKRSFFAGISYYQDAILVTNIEYNKKNKPHLTQENTVWVEPFTYPRDNSSPGGLIPIDQLDTRLFAAAIYKNKLTGASSLWTAHAIGVDKSGRFIYGSDSDFVREGRSASRWYKIGNVYSTKPKLFQLGSIYDSEEPSGRRAVQYFNPSIAASGQGHSVVSGTTDAYNQYLNVFAAGRYFGDELGTSRAPVKATSTTAIYAPYIDFGYGIHEYINRWGDYSQTVVDPLDDQTIWTFQEYADVDDSYGVRVVQFKAPPPATPAAIGTLSNKTDTTITLEGSSVDNSGFFDPGKDVGGPGYNRLSVKSTGDVIVSNIKFVSPTKITVKLNTKGKPAGEYILIITNPDGQLVVAKYEIASPVITVANSSAAQRALHDEIAKTYITASEVRPNPTTGSTTLQITAAKEHEGKIVLFNVDGKQIFEKSYSFSKGTNQTILPIEKFARGTYIAAVYDVNKVLLATQQIVKQ